MFAGNCAGVPFLYSMLANAHFRFRKAIVLCEEAILETRFVVTEVFTEDDPEQRAARLQKIVDAWLMRELAQK